MTILIDGYNLLHVTRFAPVGNSEDVLRRSREALLAFLAEKLTDSERQATTVVFDAPDKKFGLPDAYAFAGIELRFARTYNSADDLIEQLIQADPCPERLVVVSSDHRIHRFAARRKAACFDSDVWFDHLVERRPPAASEKKEVADTTKPVPAASTDEWLAEFESEELQKLEGQADSLLAANDQNDASKSNQVKGDYLSDEEWGDLDNPFPDDYFDD
ncbi:MAG: NYN domain-containing protein [Planctomycetales bacterium]|nr:NYN domain-containing protein [Planctomycetales bacterium]